MVAPILRLEPLDFIAGSHITPELDGDGAGLRASACA